MRFSVALLALVTAVPAFAVPTLHEVESANHPLKARLNFKVNDAWRRLIGDIPVDPIRARWLETISNFDSDFEAFVDVQKAKDNLDKFVRTADSYLQEQQDVAILDSAGLVRAITKARLYADPYFEKFTNQQKKTLSGILADIPGSPESALDALDEFGY
ncbi:hypothetical protein FRB99_007789 [Tulasnella sp. 403]|nr:hypothetical protein FRB99_007789 [Tulasnella sp. 403]